MTNIPPTHFGSRILITAMASVALGLAFAPATAFASDTFSESAAQTSRGAGSEDENITDYSSENDPDDETAAPPEKGGDVARSRGCKITVDNWTKWKIQIFVNGVYRGLVPTYGAIKGAFNGSRHAIYAVADFKGGKQLTWGPRTFNCNGSYTWKLNPS